MLHLNGKDYIGVWRDPDHQNAFSIPAGTTHTIFDDFDCVFIESTEVVGDFYDSYRIINPDIVF